MTDIQESVFEEIRGQQGAGDAPNYIQRVPVHNLWSVCQLPIRPGPYQDAGPR